MAPSDTRRNDQRQHGGNLIEWARIICIFFAINKALHDLQQENLFVRVKRSEKKEPPPSTERSAASGNSALSDKDTDRRFFSNYHRRDSVHPQPKEGPLGTPCSAMMILSMEEEVLKIGS